VEPKYNAQNAAKDIGLIPIIVAKNAEAVAKVNISTFNAEDISTLFVSHVLLVNQAE
jgi:hypothetical protein